MAAGMVSRTPFASTRPNCWPWRAKQAHHRCPFHPGDLLQLLAPLAEGNEKDVAPDVFAENRQHFGAAHFREPRGLDAARALNAEAGVAFEVSLQEENASGQAAQHDQCAHAQKNTACGTGRTPPGAAGPLLIRPTLARPVLVPTGLTRPGRTRPILARSAGAHSTWTLAAGTLSARGWRCITIHGIHFQRHDREAASGWGRTLLHAPEARLRGRFISPLLGTVFCSAF